MVTHCMGEANSMTSQGVTASGGGTGSPAASPSPTQIDTSTTSVQSQPRRTNENRRSNKPIMEKRRRARINNCLNELKSLILDAMKKDPARHSKLEKADILEMTVKHLENMQRQQIAMTAATDPQILNKFRAGFSECAGEVGRFPGLEPPVRKRLLQHLANVLNSSTGTENNNNSSSSNNNNTSLVTTSMQTTPISTQQPTVQSAGVQVHILPANEAPHNGILFSTTTTGTGIGGLQLVPTRLPNGDIALVLPSANNNNNNNSNSINNTRQQQISSPTPTANMPSSLSITSSPLPMLIPIPSRTSSAESSASSVSSLSSSSSSGNSSTTKSTSTSPISFDRLTVNTTPSPQPQSPITNHPITTQSPQQLPLTTRQQAPQQNYLNRDDNNHQFIENNHQTTILNHQQQIPQQQLQRNNYLNQHQIETKPLSLVIKKRYPDVIVEEEKPWRPW
ncbi:bHLH transcriptional repressor hairy [Lycorma delicatula]|uniref:bHLH transcriptional repressor hairy n=1 Tax=Lycorma delicatula TaxID=130591 RepID=UPI003F518EBD